MQQPEIKRLGKPPEGGAPPIQEVFDRSLLTTPEMQKVYDDMLEKDFMEIDPKTKKPVTVDAFYKVLHVYPRFVSSNQDEYRARFVVEKFEYVMDPTGVKKRQVLTSFDLFADEFRANYQPTIIESIASLSRQQV